MADQSKKSICLFNCDKLYSLDIVETFLKGMNKKHGFNFAVGKQNFALAEMDDFCETTIPRLQMDYAIFVVNANESRLSINEDNAGIGYARVYKALLKATKDRVLIVIGADDNYRDKDEEERVVISRWARRKVASQFDEEYFDGRKSFIFSWDKMHREIHEEALLHYFDPSKDGKKFEPKPKREPVTTTEEPPTITSPPANDSQEKIPGEADRSNSKRELRPVRDQPNYGGDKFSC